MIQSQPMIQSESKAHPLCLDSLEYGRCDDSIRWVFVRMPSSQELLIGFLLCILVRQPLQGRELLHCSCFRVPHRLLLLHSFTLVVRTRHGRHRRCALGSTESGTTVLPPLEGAAECLAPAPKLSLFFLKLFPELRFPIFLLLATLPCFFLLPLHSAQLLASHLFELLLLPSLQLFSQFLSSTALTCACFLLLGHFLHHPFTSSVTFLLLHLARLLFKNAPASILLGTTRCCERVVRWRCMRLEWGWRRLWWRWGRLLLIRLLRLLRLPLALQCFRLLLQLASLLLMGLLRSSLLRLSWRIVPRL
mmetsp:Transcript_2684/g.6926  ORF Transcript_2684/g.6926 Transcript_2684/m.6926 type:complete len:305 (-) Transcript_2684:890-1804(-)